MAACVERFELREATPAAREDVAAVMRECGDYYRLVQGRPAQAEDVDKFFSRDVPGIDPGNVRAYGIYSGPDIVGLAGLVLGWKRPGQSMIGLLLVSERHRKRGFARAACDALEAIARASGHGQSLRIGIVGTNAAAFGFWRRLGFRENGERYVLEEFLGDVVILEKDLDG